jgi:branched-chain amino acid transport system permease protein
MLIQAIINGILLGGVYALMSIGLCLSFAVARVANSAHAAFAILSSFITYWLYTLLNLDPLLGTLVSAGILFPCGIVIQKTMLHRFIGKGPLMPFTFTFFLALALENLMVIFWRNEYRAIVVPYTAASITIGEISISALRLVAFILSIVIAAILALVVKYTYFGKAIRAVAQNREAAQLYGVSLERIYALTYGLTLMLAGVGGGLFSIIYPFYPSLQATWIGLLYAVVIFGGLESPLGSFVAAMIMGVLTSVIGVITQAMWGNVVMWIVVIIILLIKPSGLFGR